MKAKIRKEAYTVEEAREIEKHLDSLEFDYECRVKGNWECKNGTPLHPNGDGCPVTKIGYKWVTIKLNRRDDDEYKCEPSEYWSADYDEPRIVFYIQG